VNKDENSPSCLVKIDDSPLSELKLNDIFYFVGIFTYTEIWDDTRDCENDCHHFPPIYYC